MARTYLSRWTGSPVVALTPRMLLLKEGSASGILSKLKEKEDEEVEEEEEVEEAADRCRLGLGQRVKPCSMRMKYGYGTSRNAGTSNHP